MRRINFTSFFSSLHKLTAVMIISMLGQMAVMMTFITILGWKGQVSHCTKNHTKQNYITQFTYCTIKNLLGGICCCQCHCSLMRNFIAMKRDDIFPEHNVCQPASNVTVIAVGS